MRSGLTDSACEKRVASIEAEDGSSDDVYREDDGGDEDSEGELSPDALIGDGANEDPVLNKFLCQEVAFVRDDIGYGNFAKAYSLLKRDFSNYEVLACSVKLLSREQERILANAFQSGGRRVRKLVIDTFIIANQRFVFKCALRKSRENGIPVMDCINNGNLGFYDAVPKFDPDTGFMFMTYAQHWTNQRMDRAASDDFSGPYRIPVHVELALKKINRARAHFSSLDIVPTPEEIVGFVLAENAVFLLKKRGIVFTDDDVEREVEKMSKERQTLLNIIKNEPRRSFSLNGQVSGSGKSGDDSRLFEEVIGSNDVDKTANYVVGMGADDSDLEENSRYLRVRYALNLVRDIRDRIIVCLRSGIVLKPMILEDVGAICSLNRERVRQLEVRGIESLGDVLKYNKISEMDASKGLGYLEANFEANRNNANLLHRRICEFRNNPQSGIVIDSVIKKFFKKRSLEVPVINMLFSELLEPLTVAEICGVSYEEIASIAEEVFDEMLRLEKIEGKQVSTPEASQLSPEDQLRS